MIYKSVSLYNQYRARKEAAWRLLSGFFVVFSFNLIVTILAVFAFTDVFQAYTSICGGVKKDALLHRRKDKNGFALSSKLFGMRALNN